MAKYSQEAWYHDYLHKQMEKYGDFPPPYVLAPDEHPLSMFWRMGGGESHLMVFFEWFESQFKTHEAKIEYLLKWPIPPCWFGWVVETIWPISDDVTRAMEKGEEYDYSPYFEKLTAYGFRNTDKFEADFNDERWFNN